MTTGRMYRNLVPRERTLGTRSNVVQCAWCEREPRHKSLMTSNIHFVWRSTDEAKLEHIREKKYFRSEKESDYIDHYTGNNSSHDNKSYVCL